MASRSTVQSMLTDAQKKGYMAALALLRDTTAAEDALQEANVRTLKAHERYRESEPFYPWFHRILKNYCLDILARRKRRPQVSDPQPIIERVPTAPRGEAELIQAQRDAILHRALGQLSSSHREILQMRHWQDLSYEEIAAVLECPVGTVMSRLYRARKALQNVLNSDPDWRA